MNPKHTANDLGTAHLRVARPTDNMAAILKFYRDGLGFDVLCEFKDHDGFEGVMLGREGAAYHLEFTRKENHYVGRAPTEDNLLVFYLPCPEEWNAAVARMEKAGYFAVKSFNPYWDDYGKTFEDSDGYRIVLQNASWGRESPLLLWREGPRGETSVIDNDAKKSTEEQSNEQRVPSSS